MILLNFSHPLTPEQMEQIQKKVNEPIEDVINIPVHFDNQQPFLNQLEELVRLLPLNAEQYQTTSLLMNPPSLNFITALLLAELHGRMGYFPPIIRMRPVEGALPPRFEVAEILNLQAVREAARKERY
ncbi:MAG: CRISPR-associated protein Csx15 [Anaerolineales bacterium]